MNQASNPAERPSKLLEWSRRVRSALRNQASTTVPDSREVFALPRWEWVAIAVLVLLSWTIHGYFRMRGFGEQDEARFAVYALTWRETGAFPIDTYTNRTSPLYLIYLRLALAGGLSPLAIPSHLNFINVIVGGLCLVPAFLLFRRLAQDAWSAFFAVVVYWFVPAFWIGNGYGMPHIPALGFMLLSLVLLADAAHREAKAFRIRVLLAALCMSASTCLKSDIALCALAFPATLFCLRSTTQRNLLASILIPATSVAAVFLVSRLFLRVPESATDFARSWNTTFPFSTHSLENSSHLRLLKNSLGGVLWLTAAASAVVVLPTRHRRLAVLVLAWTVPVYVFWGLIWANGIRHFTAALCPVPLLITVGARTLVRSTYATAAALFALLAFNYQSAPTTDHPHSGTPRLFESHAIMQRRTSFFMQSCRRFAEYEAPRKLLVGSWVIPYCEFAVIARAERFTRKVVEPASLWELEIWPHGSSTSRLVRIRAGAQAVPEFRERARWFAWNPELGRQL